MKKSLLLGIAIIVIIGAIFYLEEPKQEVVLPEPAEDVVEEKAAEDVFSPYPKAPEIIGTQSWINSEPLSIGGLKGKVVLVDFWTYTCINCIRTFPYIKEWDDKYRDKGLVIIGIHTPEFAFEKKLENVQKAVQKYELKYAIVQDNNRRTWDNYNNHYWPHKYLIDKNGRIRYDHIGEGAYQETELQIQKLLAELGEDVKDMGVTEIEPLTKFRLTQTPELYAGYKFARRELGNKEGYSPGQVVDYKLPEKILGNRIYLSGKWKNNPDDLQHADTNEGFILLKFTAKTVHIVGSPMGKDNVEVDIYLDDNYVPKEKAGEDIRYDGERSYILLDDERLYNLLGQGNEYGTYTIKISTKSPDFFWSAFTFGG